MHRSSERRRPRHLLAATSVVVLIAGASCGGSDDDGGASADDPAPTSAGAEGSPAADGAPAAGPDSAATALDGSRAVIDVRTPDEYDAGHVEDAELIDIQGDDFDVQVDDLDPEGSYVVYCRTGRRSAAATERMREIGLDVLDGGALDDMLAAGWPPAD